MNLLILFETIKFHKVKQEMAVRVLFLFCFAMNTLIYFFPGSDPDLSALNDATALLMQGEQATPVLTEGNIVFMGLMAAASIVTLLCAYTYAALFAGEQMEMTTSQIMAGILRALPALAACGILLIVPAIFSSLLLFIPLLVVLTALYFLPLNLIIGRKKLTDALSTSVRDTRHAKMIIFMQFVLLMSAMSIPEILLVNLLPAIDMVAVLVAAFFIAARAMMRGRLMAILYLNLVKKVPIVIPSKPTV